MVVQSDVRMVGLLVYTLVDQRVDPSVQKRVPQMVAHLERLKVDL